MRYLLSALVGGIVLATAAVAAADDSDTAGLYFGADVGLFEFDLPGEAAQLPVCRDGGCDSIGSPDYDDVNFRISAVIGRGIVGNLRAEGEIFFDVDSASGSKQEGTTITHSVSGDVRTYGVMLNAWYDFGFDTTWSVYIGGGTGLVVAETSHRIEDLDDVLPSLLDDDSDAETAYQIGFGINFEGWHAGYRYLGSSDLNDYGSINQHVLMVGLRIW